ncbi:MAG: serine/threonine protein kinase, partial [Pirellula sp.]
NPDVDLGGIATPIGASFLMQAFDTQKTTVELPRPTADTISKEYPLEANGQYLMFFVPIFSPQDPSEVMAVMMVRSELFLADLQVLISASVHSESNCYLLDDRGSIATQARDLDQLKKLPVFAENRMVHGTHVMEARDPGGDLLAGFVPGTAQEEWAWTKPGKTVSLSKNGSDMEGYRDYRGKNVVGAWHWIEPLQRLLVLELPKETAYKTLGFIDRAFRIVYSIPLAVALILGLLSLRRSFTKMDLTNKSIGAYKLKEKIGEGGLGIVYKAEHLLLGRTAAIKLIKEPFANAGAMRRFEREVRLAAKLSHPNTVSIYDFGVSTSGLPYCAMELVEGVNLAYFIGYDPSISADRCIWLLRQICGAIEEAHESGLIHRDIKPQNIMVCQRGQLCDLVKVVDFGLAKTMADNVSRDVTATRVLIGTPGFIAPERLETPWIADPRIDIFAFGVLGVYLLSGKVPVLGATHQSLLQQLQLGRFRDLCPDKYFSSLVALLACCSSSNSIKALQALYSWHQSRSSSLQLKDPAAKQHARSSQSS